MLPSKRVVSSLQNTTLPPSPLPVASARTDTLPSAVTVVALAMPLSLPCQPPPTFTVPPPVAPLASSVAPPSSAIDRPVTTIEPPFPVAELASSVPETCVLPPAASPSSRMRPPRATRPFASMTPVLLTTLPSNASAPRAVSATRPPAALMLPLFSAAASSAPRSTLTLIRPSPTKSRLTVSPAASAVLPPGVEMVPLLLTFGAISTTTPPAPVRMSPLLITAPAPLPPVKRLPPAMKSLSEMPSDEATSPPTLTCAPVPMTTPFGFSNQTLPLALMLPRMLLAGPPPVTRLSAMLLALGCSKRTAAPAPTSNEFQLVTTRCVACDTVSWLPTCVRVAAPATTLPPVGKACAMAPPEAPSTRAAASAPAAPETPDVRLPRPEVCSATAT